MNEDKKIIIEEIKNSGLILADTSSKQYHSKRFGALGIKHGGVDSPLKDAPVLFPTGKGWAKVDREIGNPEIQFNQKFDTFSCVIFGIAKAIRNYIYKRYGKLYSIEEMYNAYWADVIPGRGTTIEKGFNSFYKKGWIADDEFPEYAFTPKTTAKEYFRKPPEYIIIAAKRKLDIWKICWEVIPTDLESINEYYKRACVVLTGFAWASYYGTGVYYDYNNPANHCFLGLELLDNGNNLISDTYPKDMNYVENSKINAGDLFKELHKTYKYGSAHACWVEPIAESIISKIMDQIIQLKNGWLGWLKANTKKVQHITPENAGLAAITHIMRKEPQNVIHLEDEQELKEKGYELTDEYFGSENTNFLKKLFS